MNLEKLGWNNYFEEEFRVYFNKGLIAGRIVSQQKNNYLLHYEKGIIAAKLAGKFRYNVAYSKDLPAIGDWVAVQLIEGSTQGIIQGVLPRKNCFARKQPISGGRKIRNGIIVGGHIEEQVVASNIDTAFIVSGLDGNFNITRIERYITLAYNSGVNPVIILNKADACNNIDEYKTKVNDIAIGIPIFCISAISNIGMEVFKEYLSYGKTVVFFGSSGVGKSTIINYLLGEEKQKTGSVSSANGKGRHTTTSKELFYHDSGAMIIDTPGLRELQLWGDENGVEESFKDVASLAGNCKFKDCNHDKEPGCAIKQAIEDGIISQERFESYIKQLGEIKRLSKEKRQYEIFKDRKSKRGCM